MCYSMQDVAKMKKKTKKRNFYVSEVCLTDQNETSKQLKEEGNK